MNPGDRLPRVSVVVPAYNNVRHIDATVHSILSQTYTDFELILSDHSSTDGTWERLQSFAGDPRVRLMRVPTGGGAPANWNAVTAAARGELLKLVCGDDLLYPTGLAEQVAAFDEHPEAVLVAGQRDVVDETGVPVIRARGLQHLHGLIQGPTAIRRTVRAGTNVFGEPACVLFRRTALLADGGWDARSPYLIDQATCARVLLRGPMVAIRRSLAGFRISAQQWSVSLSKEQSEHARMFHKLIRTEHPEVLSPWDVRLGDARATLMAYKRRAAYIWLRRRMGHSG
ncbi:Glycosyl transferase family 2 [Nakamurella panacisegetis]|uniref:Glycosyl transferase family 2 n=1 Tax=Nakamurella panacisegetis TaxID=1090615 RepID=A0A1H0PIB6_9ACTN|nr:glycosyltransferase family 2 protein [Nakamurella panacisegetis]SDP04743.1 Glycosyl transferase family 2 [Nakamurella panacisegetis]